MTSVQSWRGPGGRILFDESPEIVVPVNEHDESWGVTLPSGEMLIGTPGGGVALDPPNA